MKLIQDKDKHFLVDIHVFSFGLELFVQKIIA